MAKKSENGNHATRCTILIDDALYHRTKQAALQQEIKLYEYINKVLAAAVKMKAPKKIKHYTPKPPKVPVPKKEEKTATPLTVSAPPVAAGSV